MGPGRRRAPHAGSPAGPEGPPQGGHGGWSRGPAHTASSWLRGAGAPDGPEKACEQRVAKQHLQPLQPTAAIAQVLRRGCQVSEGRGARSQPRDRCQCGGGYRGQRAGPGGSSGPLQGASPAAPAPAPQGSLAPGEGVPEAVPVQSSRAQSGPAPLGQPSAAEPEAGESPRSWSHVAPLFTHHMSPSRMDRSLGAPACP